MHTSLELASLEHAWGASAGPPCHILTVRSRHALTASKESTAVVTMQGLQPHALLGEKPTTRLLACPCHGRSLCTWRQPESCSTAWRLWRLHLLSCLCSSAGPCTATALELSISLRMMRDPSGIVKPSSASSAQVMHHGLCPDATLGFAASLCLVRWQRHVKPFSPPLSAFSSSSLLSLVLVVNFYFCRFNCCSSQMRVCRCSNQCIPIGPGNLATYP